MPAAMVDPQVSQLVLLRLKPPASSQRRTGMELLVRVYECVVAAGGGCLQVGPVADVLFGCSWLLQPLPPANSRYSHTTEVVSLWWFSTPRGPVEGGLPWASVAVFLTGVYSGLLVNSVITAPQRTIWVGTATVENGYCGPCLDQSCCMHVYMHTSWHMSPVCSFRPPVLEHLRQMHSFLLAAVQNISHASQQFGVLIMHGHHCASCVLYGSCVS